MSATIVPARKEQVTPASTPLVDGLARRLVLSRLRGLSHGQLILEDEGGVSHFGESREGAGPTARVRVVRPSFWREIATGGTVGAGHSYMSGGWECDDLTGLVRILLRNRDALTSLEGGVARLGALAGRAIHMLRRNTIRGSRENITAHYDLGNEFYELFLDGGMNYSCAWFEEETVDLDAAAASKLERICRKLDLHPGEHLLEIGTGWGSLAIHAAKYHGCRVTTTTISERQLEYARRRVQEEGLEDRITLLRSDYRDLEGRYDKLVSIEMVEAVGHEYLDEYFARCSALLKPGGLFVLQGIVIAEEYHEEARRSVDFVKRYIFPGCHIPSVSSLTGAAGLAGGFRVLHMEDIGLHYALTLRRWRERFLSRLPEVRRMGFPQSFIRMWEFYLSYCEGGFAERSTGNIQAVLCKPSA